MLASRQAQSCVKCLESSQIAEVEPELGTRFSQALYVPGEAQIDNRGFLKAVGLALEEAGVECHWEAALEDGNLPDSGIMWIAVAWVPRAICAIFEVFVARLCVCKHPRS